MINKHRARLDTLFTIARDVAPVAAARIVAAVVHKNEIISLGTCEYKTHPFQSKFGRNKECLFWHAETRAIHNALRHLHGNDFKKATLYVARAKKDPKGNFVFGLARPCNGCQSCIAMMGFKDVIYTCNDGGFAFL